MRGLYWAAGMILAQAPGCDMRRGEASAEGVERGRLGLLGQWRGERAVSGVETPEGVGLGARCGQRPRWGSDSLPAEASQESLRWMRRMETAAVEQDSTSFVE